MPAREETLHQHIFLPREKVQLVRRGGTQSWESQSIPEKCYLTKAGRGCSVITCAWMSLQRPGTHQLCLKLVRNLQAHEGLHGFWNPRCSIPNVMPTFFRNVKRASNVDVRMKMRKTIANSLFCLFVCFSKSSVPPQRS